LRRYEIGPIKFHLDEQIESAIARGLRVKGIDVTTSTEAKLLHANDVQQLEYARGQGRVLVTYDDDFLRLDAKGVGHAGIVYVRRNRSGIGEVLQKLLNIQEAISAEAMIDHVEYR